MNDPLNNKVCALRLIRERLIELKESSKKIVDKRKQVENDKLIRQNEEILAMLLTPEVESEYLQ